MGLRWDQYHVWCKHTKLFIGKGNIVDGKDPIILSESEDRTEEIIYAVMKKFKILLRRRDQKYKPYCGYRIDGIGTLVFVDEGFNFIVTPKPDHEL